MSQMKGLTHLIVRASFHVTVLLFVVFDLSTASKNSLLGSSWTLPLQQPIRGLLQDNEKSEVSHWYPAWDAEGDNHHKGDPHLPSPVETKHGQGHNTKKAAYKTPHNGLHIIPPSIPTASPPTQIFKCHARFIYGAFVYNQANDPTAALDVYVSNTGSMDLGYSWSFVMYNAHYTEYTSSWNLKNVSFSNSSLRGVAGYPWQALPAHDQQQEVNIGCVMSSNSSTDNSFVPTSFSINDVPCSISDDAQPPPFPDAVSSLQEIPPIIRDNGVQPTCVATFAISPHNYRAPYTPTFSTVVNFYVTNLVKNATPFSLVNFTMYNPMYLNYSNSWNIQDLVISNNTFRGLVFSNYLPVANTSNYASYTVTGLLISSAAPDFYPTYFESNGEVCTIARVTY